MIEKEQWPPNNSPNLSVVGSDARSFFETFFRSQKSFWVALLENILDNFLQVLCRIFEKDWQEYMKGYGIHSEHFSLVKQCSQLWFMLSRIVETNFTSDVVSAVYRAYYVACKNCLNLSQPASHPATLSATTGWLAGWLSVRHTPVLHQNG